MSNIDPTVLTVLLDGLESILKYGDRSTMEEIFNIFEKCGGTGRLEALQYHKNEQVYQKVAHLLQNYWECGEVSPQTVFGNVPKDNKWSW